MRSAVLRRCSRHQTGWIWDAGDQRYRYRFDWDPLDRMRWHNGPGINRVFAHTADGERIVERDVTSGVTTISLRGLDAKVLREVKLENGSYSWQKDYIYRESQILASHGHNEPLQHYHLDHLGTPRMLSNRCGERLQRFESFPFGEAIAELPQHPEKMRLTGHQRDLNQPTTTEDDLDYMHARYYGTKMGRFASVDPSSRSIGAERPQSWNRYSYARSNPLRFLDPDGNDEVEYGGTKLTIFPGDVLVVRGSKEGDYHVVTYVGGGKPGQIMVVENSPGRNRDLSVFGPGTVEKLRDNTGSSHPPVDLLALQVNGQPNSYHPDNGGKALGAVQHDGPPLTGEQVKAAAATVTMAYMSPPDYKQCTHFVLELARMLEVKLRLAPERSGEDPEGVGRFVRSVASRTARGGLPPAP